MRTVTEDAFPVAPEVVEKMNDQLNGYRLPRSFVDFMALNNTGSPLNDGVALAGKQYCIAYFMSFDQEDVYYYYGQLLESFLQSSNGIMIPFAVNDSSDYYCLSLLDGGVYFQQHESEEDEFIPLNISFEAFVDLL